MSLSARDIAFYITALLAFPLLMTLASLAASDEEPDRTAPLFHRSGGGHVPSATND